MLCAVRCALCCPLSQGRDVDDVEFAELMAEIDVDGSGELDFDEFLTWWRGQDQAAKAQLMALSALNFDFIL